MDSLRKEISAISDQQWTILISMLVVVNMVVLGGLVFLLALHSPHGLVLAQAPATRTPLPTFTTTATGAAFARPTQTSTRVPTWTPGPTPTPTSTRTPTATRRPARGAQPAQAIPQTTPIPEPTATPVYDYIGTVRQLTACENEGKHHIFIYVRDANGVSLPDVNLKVSWPGGEGSEAFMKTGTKAEDPGLADFAMFKGSYYVEVADGFSEVIGPISPDIPLNEVCVTSGNTQANSLYHYSFEVIFTKVR